MVGRPRPFGWANDYFFYQPELELHLREGFSQYPNVQLVPGAEFTGLEQSDGRFACSTAPQRVTASSPRAG